MNAYLLLAQNSSPYWSQTGNSNANNSSKLGTTNAINLRIFTNNVERMRIASSGLVGVNISAPTARFHINSSAGQSSLIAAVNGTTRFQVHSWYYYWQCCYSAFERLKRFGKYGNRHQRSQP
jgi:hypothetical protein